jgi:glycosyltransferase involved in cell wall biosynthesis
MVQTLFRRKSMDAPPRRLIGRESLKRSSYAARQFCGDWWLSTTRLLEEVLRKRSSRQPWKVLLLDIRDELCCDFEVAHTAPDLPPANDGPLPSKGGRRRTIVVVEETFPEPMDHSGAYRLTNAFNLGLQLGYRVVVVSLRDQKRAVLEHPLREVTDLRPTGSWTAPVLVRDLTTASVLWVCRPHAGGRMHSLLKTARSLPRPETVVYYPVDMHHVRLRRWAEHIGDRRLLWQARLMRATERALVRRSDRVVVPTADEQRTVEALDRQASAFVVPTIHEPIAMNGTTADGRRGLLFYGGFAHTPNIDAVDYLVHDVMPRIREQVPDVILTIAGSDPRGDVHRLQLERESDVVYLGWVPDLAALVDKSRVMIAPLRFGAGMKGKIGYAIARGLPVVTTTIGDEGFGLTNREPRLVVDNADDLAASCVWLLTDDEAWQRCSTLCHDASSAFAPSQLTETIAAILTPQRAPRSPKIGSTSAPNLATPSR